MLHYLFIDYLIHDLEALDGLLLCDTNISLLQGHRAETTEKKKINMQKVQTRKCVALTESDLLRCQPNMAAYALTFFFLPVSKRHTCCRSRTVPWQDPHAGM